MSKSENNTAFVIVAVLAVLGISNGIYLLSNGAISNPYRDFLQELNESTLNEEVGDSPMYTSYPSTINNGDGDYFIGTPSEQQAIVTEITNNTASFNPTDLYLAARTAHLINDIESASFLLYMAQIRSSTDKERFNLVDDGNSIATYWNFLNALAGERINGDAPIDYAFISRVFAKVEQVNPLISENNQYAGGDYPDSLLSLTEANTLATANRESFMQQYARPFKELLSTQKGIDAFTFVRDYNNGTIPKNEVNDAKYKESDAYASTFFE